MAPGCFATLSQEVDETTLVSNSKEIPLPEEPAPLSQTTHVNAIDSQESEIDSFEILEQTILKQKRLARLKNTDLRRKILLKRTFDLVCEIMDHENGFEQESEDSDQEDLVETNESSSSSSSSDSSSDEDSEEESEQNLENDLNAKQNLTLVKLDDEKSADLDDLYSNLDLVEFGFEDYIEDEGEENIPQAQVPVKRRASQTSDSDEDFSDDESDDVEDQQLSIVNTNLSNLSNQLNLYNDNRKKVYRKKRRLVHDNDDENSLIRVFFLEDISKKRRN